MPAVFLFNRALTLIVGQPFFEEWVKGRSPASFLTHSLCCMHAKVHFRYGRDSKWWSFLSFKDLPVTKDLQSRSLIAFKILLERTTKGSFGWAFVGVIGCVIVSQLDSGSKNIFCTRCFLISRHPNLKLSIYLWTKTKRRIGTTQITFLQWSLIMADRYGCICVKVVRRQRQVIYHPLALALTIKRKTVWGLKKTSLPKKVVHTAFHEKQFNHLRDILRLSVRYLNNYCMEFWIQIDWDAE